MLILLIDRGYLLSNPDTVTFWQLTSFSLVDYMVTGQYTGSSPFGHCLSDPALKSQARSANGSCVYISMSLSSPLSLQPLQPTLGLACRDTCYYKPPSNSSMSSATVKRQIGDATFSAIGYGAMGIAAAYGPALPDEERFKVRPIFMELLFALTSPRIGPRRRIRERDHTLGHRRRLPRQRAPHWAVVRQSSKLDIRNCV